MSTGVTLLRQAQRAVSACSGLSAVNGHTMGSLIPVCTQVAAARWPWTAVNAWQSQGANSCRFYSGKDENEPTSAAEREGSNQQQETRGSDTSTADAQQAAAAEQAEMEEGSATLDELQQLLSKAQEDAASFKEKWQRSHAEMQNLIARQAREKETMQTYAVQGFAKSLLEVADNLESAQKAIPGQVLQPGADVPVDKALGYLKSLLEGVQATEKVLHKLMAGKGVERIQIAEGDDFDPNNHEAMSTVPRTADDHRPGAVAVVWQSGYKMHDRVLRAAKVLVYQE